MSSTRRRELESPSGERRNPLRSALAPLSSLPAFAAAGLLAGCASSGTVHPDYGRLAPRVVCVAPVANETIHQLDEVTFGGLFQRTVLWPKKYRVTEILAAAAEESLLRKGYETRSGCGGDGSLAGSPAALRPVPDYRRPLPEGSALPAFDAVLYLTVEEWAADRTAGSSLHIAYRVELYRVPAAEVLYHGRFSCGYREDPYEPRPDELPIALRRSVSSALAALPAAPAE
ncbi:MAG: hypothetical protein ACUVYA_05815 [Planctomycetota bacterium]